LTFLGADAHWDRALQGLIILMAVAADAIGRRQSEAGASRAAGSGSTEAGSTGAGAAGTGAPGTGAIVPGAAGAGAPAALSGSGAS
jgi:hypothetical protein